MINTTSIIVVRSAVPSKRRIGATAKMNDSVAIVGITVATSWKVLAKPPNATLTPPRHPTINKTIEITEKRLNSASAINLSNPVRCSLVCVVFMVYKFLYHKPIRLNTQEI